MFSVWNGPGARLYVVFRPIPGSGLGRVLAGMLTLLIPLPLGPRRWFSIRAITR